MPTLLAGDALLMLLVQIAVISTLLLTVSLVARRALRRASAASRHFVLFVGSVVTLLCPAALLLVPAMGPTLSVEPTLATKGFENMSISGPDLPTRVEASQSASAVRPAPLKNTAGTPQTEPPLELTESATTPGRLKADDTTARAEPVVSVAGQVPGVLPEMAPTVSAEASGESLGWGKLATALWALGFAGSLLFMFRGVWLAMRIRLRSDAVSLPEGLLERTANRMKIDACAVVSSPLARVPLLVGLWRPRIVLPADYVEWLEAEVESAIAHELSHLVRGDLSTQLISRLTCAVFWWQPLAWLVHLALRNEQEYACDDLVLAKGGCATDYAEHLLRVAERLVTGPIPVTSAVAMARSAEVESRIRSILDDTIPRRPMRTGWRVVFVMLFALGTASALASRPVWRQGNKPSIAATDRSDPAEAAAAAAAQDANREGPTANDRIVLTGVVVGPDAKPRADVLVSVVEWISEREFTARVQDPMATTRTDTSGWFRFEMDRDRLKRAQLQARLGTLATQCPLPRSFLSGDPFRLVLFEHSPSRVTVKDANGDAVAGAFVSATPDKERTGLGHRHRIGYSKTGRDGVATLLCPTKEQTYESPSLSILRRFWNDQFELARISAVKFDVGYGEHSLPTVEGQAGSLPAQVEIKLKPMKHLTVRMLDSAGKPVLGQRLMVNDGFRGGSVSDYELMFGTTDSKGEATFGVRGGSRVSVQTFVGDPQEIAARRTVFTRFVRHNLDDGDTLEMRGKDLQRLRGRATHKGQPVKDAVAMTQSLTPGGGVVAMGMARTNASGEFEIPVAPNTVCSLTVQHAELTVQPQMIDIPKDKPPGMVELNLVEMPVLSGTIVYRDSDKPIANTEFRTDNTTPDQQVRITTDDNGRFSVRLPAGRHVIVPSVGSRLPPSNTARANIVLSTNGLSNYTVRFPIDAPKNRPVVVRGPNGKPIANAQVFAISPNRKRPIARTNELGEFQSDGAVGYTQVESPDGTLVRFTDNLRDPVVLAARAWVSGTLIDGATGKPLGDAEIQLALDTRKEGWRRLAPMTVRTDASGRFKAQVLTKTRYSIYAPIDNRWVRLAVFQSPYSATSKDRDGNPRIFDKGKIPFLRRRTP